MRYQPADAMTSPRFVGIRTFMRLPHAATADGADLAILGVPFDTAASVRPGQRFGPEAIRSAAILLRPYVRELDVDIFARCQVVDVGDASIVPGYIDDSYARIAEALQAILATGAVPVVMGGDHSITLPELRAVARQHGPVALVHLDAHTDTWDSFFGHRYDHGTTFRRAIEEGLLLPGHSLQAGMRGSFFSPRDLADSVDLGLDVVPMAEVRALGIPGLADRIHARVGEHLAFLSFDIDFVDPAFAPGTGTPEVAGPTSAEALDLVTRLAGIPFVGYDLVEVLPAADPTGITAVLAANLLHRFLALHAARSTPRSGGHQT